MKNLIFYLSYLCFCIPIFGQYQITVVRPQELSLRSIHIWNCIINNEQKIPTLCYLHGTVTEAKDGKLGEARSADFLLNTGITQFNSTNYDALRPEQVIQSNKKYEEHVIRTNSLPNGNYTVCLTAKPSVFVESVQRFYRVQLDVQTTYRRSPNKSKTNYCD